MPNVELWRLEELAGILDDLTLTLRVRNQPEWAGVFSHFLDELKRIISAETAAPDELKRLARNIQSCFVSSRTCSTLQFEDQDTPERAALNRRFSRGRACLLEALEEIENRLIEYVN
jgi:hypothetical protein